MQFATLHIPAAGYDAGDAFEVFSNADSAGRALAEIDYSRPISGPRPLDFYPLGSEPDDSLVREVQTAPLYFGVYRFAVRTRDAVGNVTQEEREHRVIVNSGPRPVSRLAHVETIEGRPVFGFVPPAQMR